MTKVMPRWMQVYVGVMCLLAIVCIQLQHLDRPILVYGALGFVIGAIIRQVSNR